MESIAAKNCGIKLCQELSALWGKSYMHARKWLSNSRNFVEKISARYVQMSLIYQTNIYHQWKHLECKARSIHIPQCANWSALSIHQAKFVEKFFVTLWSTIHLGFVPRTSQEKSAYTRCLCLRNRLGLRIK